MFDSLKEKLGRFQEDVEETAEEKAEEAGEAEDVEGAPPEGSIPEDAPAERDGESVPEDAPAEPDDESAHSEGEAASPTEVPDADPSPAEPGANRSGAADPPESGEAPPAPDAEADVEAEADDERPPEEGTSKSTGFVRKAKSMARGRVVIEEEDLEGPLWDLEMALLESDVEMTVAEEILDGIEGELVGETRTFRESTGSVVEDALRSALLDVISVGQFDFDARVAEAEKPVVIVFTGVNGVGKTTTIAKLSRYFEERGLSSVLANGDTYRAGANEQIAQHAEALDRKLIAHEQGGDPAAVIYDAVEYAQANDVDVVLGDTAGRLHTDEGLMDQLEKIHRVVDPDMTVFVDEAVAGQDATQRAREFDEAAAIDGTILTKADADAQGGAAISIAHVTGKPILFLGTGQDYDDLERFDPEWLVDRLLGEA